MKMFSRKPLMYLLALAIMFISFESTGLSVALAEKNNAPANQGTIKLPVTSANPSKVFFPDYGQFVANPLLRFWRVNGRYNAFGGPLSRTFMDAEGHTVQYFQKMALAYFPELAGTTWEVRPYHIGRLALEAQSLEAQQAFPFGAVNAINSTKTQKYFPETGHTLTGGFFDLYNRTGALFIWGFPLSEEYQLTQPDGKVYTAQLFERGRMLWSKDTGAMIDAGFSSEVATLLKVNVAVDVNADPLPGQQKIPDYNSWAWEHWVDVNLATQSETFYEGDVPVRNNLVTTGKPGYSTPTGTFHILRRVYNERMKGGSIGSEDYYDLSNVLFTQYFTWEGHALHYAWWRSNFGVTGSHGCVNQDYASSEFAWNWMTIGSRVNIHY